MVTKSKDLIPTITRLHYSSVAAMAADSAAPFIVPYNESKARQHLTIDKGMKWHGIEGGATACAAALRDGVPHIEGRIADLLQGMAASLPRALGHNRAKLRGESGDELDIHAVNMGRCDKAWTRSARRIKVGTGIIRLVVDIGGNATQSADRLMWRGVAATMLTRVMEKAGYSVEIVAACAVWGHFNACWLEEKQCAVSVVVKGRHGKADLGLLSATVCLPGFFRSQCFAQIIRTCDMHGEKVDGSLGHYTDVSALLLADAKVTTLAVPAEIGNEKTCLKWVKQSVQLLQHSTISKEGR